MTTIDDRVVALHFDNKTFQSAVRSTLADLDNLKKGLKLEGATKGLQDLGAAGKQVQLGHIASSVQAISDKFKAMSVIGVTALATVANKAVTAGSTMLKSLTLDPIIAGFREYETNIGSIQTVLANTGREGAKGLQEVNSALDQLNTYADQTIYNFSQMAKNIGTFTAAGVSLEVATSAIKGISNLAAVSGSNAEQASAAMYQLSQAISAGKVSLEDWNSVVNAGMGGKVFQDSLMETARVHGVAIDQMVKDEGSFRLTLQKGWLTSEILTETLSKFTGDLNASQLKTMGYNDQQIAGILKMGQVAQDAATKVKTMSQLISTIQEAVGSGWAKTWQILFGDFNEARDLFTNLSDVIGGFVQRSNESRNKVLSDWKELGGRAVLIEGVSNAFKALISVVKPIGDAFRQIFPATTAKQLYDLTVSFRNFAAGLKMGEESAANLKRTFAGVFAAIDIVRMVVTEAIKMFLKLFGVASEGSGSILKITGNIGDFLVGVRNAIKNGDGLVKLFESIGKVLALPIGLLKSFASAVASLFDKFDGQGAAKAVTGVFAKFEPLTTLSDKIVALWSRVGSVVSKVSDSIEPIVARLVSMFTKMGSAVSEAMGGIDFGDVLGGINTGLFAGVVLMLKNLIGGGGSGGIFESINDTFQQLTDTLGAMQNTLRAATLLEIAIAVGILALSVSKLSTIDADGLTRALTAMTIMFTQLFASMAIFEKVANIADMGKMGLITGAMILLAIAVNILATAVKKLADLSWEELAKGLIGVTAVLGGLVAAVAFIPDDKKLMATSLALVVLASAVKILASAVTDLSGLSWEELTKGLIGVGAILVALTLFTKFAEADKAGILQGAGILLLAAGIKVMASAVTQLAGLSWGEIGRGLAAMAGGLALMAASLYILPPSSILSAAAILIVAASLGMIGDAIEKMAGMSWGEIGRGLTVMAGALTLIAAALWAIPPTALLSAAGVLVVAASLGMIADGLKSMAKMSWEEIAKGLVSLAGALLIISVAMIAMTGTLSGAAALLVVVAALSLLTPILQTFSQMSWAEIGKGLLVLAAALGIIGVAGLLIAPIVPALLGLGAAILLIGVGVLAAGVGVLAFATALTALSVSGAAATAVIVAMVKSMAALIPEVMAQIGRGLLEFAKVIAQAGPAITSAITTVLLAIIQAIETITPKIITTMYKLLTMLLETIANHMPKLIESGVKIIKALLDGISKNIGDIVTKAVDVIVAFINGLKNNQPRLIQAGVDFIISYINGVANAIRDNSTRMGEAGANLATAIVEGMINGLRAGAGRVASKARAVAQGALNAAMEALGVASPSKEMFKIGEFFDQGFVNGLLSMSSEVQRTAGGVGRGALDAITDSLSEIKTAVDSDLNLTPSIVPVIDLSEVRKTPGDISRILNGTPTISFDTSRNSAQDISESDAFDTPYDDDGDAQIGVIYNQYNSSPKALSSAEIYRQTKNQLSTVTKDL